MREQHIQIPELTARQLRNFQLKVNKLGPGDCWEWAAGKDRQGYGQIRLHPMGVFFAHRIAYFVSAGVDPGPLSTCHKCDNPGCCNPAHLFLGTHADNVADMVAKGRAAHNAMPGESHPRSVLTGRDVKAIRCSDATCAALAVKYGVNRTAISKVRRRKTWKHLD
jgi:hypothetical protein